MLYAFTSCSLFFSSRYCFLAEETDGLEGSNPTPIGVFDYSKEPKTRDSMSYIGPVYYLDDTYYIHKYNGDFYAIHDLDLSFPAYKGSATLTLSQTMEKHTIRSLHHLLVLLLVLRLMRFFTSIHGFN